MKELLTTIPYETILIGLFAIFVAVRFFLRLKRKIYRYTRRLRKIAKLLHKDRRNQDIVGTIRRNEPYFGDTNQNSNPHNINTDAQYEADSIPSIELFPAYNVEHIIDGDTVIVSKGWLELKIRLDSIDCPEDGQHWGDTAKYGLIKLIGGRNVRLEEHGIDHHERTLATIYVEDESGVEWINVNERMVTLGHAWVMREYYGHLPKDRKDKLNRLESWARRKGVGLWQLPNPIPPWEWRR